MSGSLLMTLKFFDLLRHFTVENVDKDKLQSSHLNLNLLYTRNLDCAVVTALFATNASFVYLLSWVILQEQFVGIRIMAVILSTTGISLLAYMDGTADSRTLGAVLIASAAAAGSAIYKVMFKKVMGEVSFGQVGEGGKSQQWCNNNLIFQVSLFFTIIGIINTVLLWPVVILLYIFGAG